MWQGGPDAYFLIDAPAFDTGVAYTLPGTGAAVPLYAGTGGNKGKLTSAVAAGAQPVAQLIEAVSATRIQIRLFAPAWTGAIPA